MKRNALDMNDTLDDENGINNDAFAVVETDIDCELGSSVETISKKVESESEDEDLDDFHVNLLDDFDKGTVDSVNVQRIKFLIHF